LPGYNCCPNAFNSINATVVGSKNAKDDEPAGDEEAEAEADEDDA
jgi:hypothetical protein